MQNVTGGASAMVRSAQAGWPALAIRRSELRLRRGDHQSHRTASRRRLHRGRPQRIPGAGRWHAARDVASTRRTSRKSTCARSSAGLWRAWSPMRCNAPTATTAQGLLKALEQTDLDVKGAIPGGRWTYYERAPRADAQVRLLPGHQRQDREDLRSDRSSGRCEPPCCD